MKITLYEFLALSDDEQYCITFFTGNYLNAMIEADRWYVLYGVGNFFVEVEYDPQNDKIKAKKAFVTGELLNKYANLN